MCQDRKIIYAEDEKRAVLTALKSKGTRRPPDWKLIHSEPCDENELSFDHAKLVKRLAERYRLEDREQKFAIDVVSNPEANSALDKGVLKVRYRYVLAAEHKGEPKIKPNSREFCTVLINQDKLYRIEDINMMSFRGVNPIAKRNYSIFRLRGHWNCRHTWQREVYLIERDNTTVENNPLINKNLEMSKEKKGIVKKFMELISTNKESLTMSEVVELSQELVKKAGLKLKEYTVGDKTLRVEGETLEEGAAVAWVDENGEMIPIENEEITVADGDKTVVIVVKDSTISEIKEPAKEDDEEEMSEEEKKKKEEEEKKKLEEEEKKKKKNEFNAEEAYNELNEKFDKLSETLTKGQDDKFSKFSEDLLSEIKSIPALKGEGVKNDFSSGSGADSENKFSHLAGKPIN